MCKTRLLYKHLSSRFLTATLYFSFSGGKSMRRVYVLWAVLGVLLLFLEPWSVSAQPYYCDAFTSIQPCITSPLNCSVCSQYSTDATISCTTQVASGKSSLTTPCATGTTATCKGNSSCMAFYNGNNTPQCIDLSGYVNCLAGPQTCGWCGSLMLCMPGNANTSVSTPVLPGGCSIGISAQWTWDRCQYQSVYNGVPCAMMTGCGVCTLPSSLTDCLMPQSVPSLCSATGFSYALNINPCQANPCQYNQTCSSVAQQSYTCSCASPLVYNNVSHVCQSPCVNTSWCGQGGSCSPGPTSSSTVFFTCTCNGVAHTNQRCPVVSSTGSSLSLSVTGSATSTASTVSSGSVTSSGSSSSSSSTGVSSGCSVCDLTTTNCIQNACSCKNSTWVEYQSTTTFCTVNLCNSVNCGGGGSCQYTYNSGPVAAFYCICNNNDLYYNQLCPIIVSTGASSSSSLSSSVQLSSSSSVSSSSSSFSLPSSSTISSSSSSTASLNATESNATSSSSINWTSIGQYAIYAAAGVVGLVILYFCLRGANSVTSGGSLGGAGNGKSYSVVNNNNITLTPQSTTPIITLTGSGNNTTTATHGHARAQRSQHWTQPAFT